MIWKHPIETTTDNWLFGVPGMVKGRSACGKSIWKVLEFWGLGYTWSYHIYVVCIYIYVFYIHIWWILKSLVSQQKGRNNNCFPAALFSSPKVLRFGPNDQNEKVRDLAALAFVGGEYAGLCVPIFWFEEGNIDGVDGYRFRGQVGSNSTGFPGSARFFFGGGHQVATGFNDK